MKRISLLSVLVLLCQCNTIQHGTGFLKTQKQNDVKNCFSLLKPETVNNINPNRHYFLPSNPRYNLLTIGEKFYRPINKSQINQHKELQMIAPTLVKIRSNSRWDLDHFLKKPFKWGDLDNTGVMIGKVHNPENPVSIRLEELKELHPISLIGPNGQLTPITLFINKHTNQCTLLTLAMDSIKVFAGQNVFFPMDKRVNLSGLWYTNENTAIITNELPKELHRRELSPLNFTYYRPIRNKTTQTRRAKKRKRDPKENHYTHTNNNNTLSIFSKSKRLRKQKNTISFSINVNFPLSRDSIKNQTNDILMKNKPSGKLKSKSNSISITNSDIRRQRSSTPSLDLKRFQQNNVLRNDTTTISESKS